MSRTPVERCVENDTEVRECTIMLYTSRLENNFVDNVLVPIDVFSVTKRVAIQLQHWSIVAQFSDKRVTYDAREDENNRLAAFRKVGIPDDILEQHVIGTVKVSPSQLLELAKKHSLNGKSYSAIIRNCQHWAKAFVHMISPELKAGMAQFWTYSEKCVKVGGPFGALYALGAYAVTEVTKSISSS